MQIKNEISVKNDLEIRKKTKKCRKILKGIKLGDFAKVSEYSLGIRLK